MQGRIKERWVGRKRGVRKGQKVGGRGRRHCDFTHTEIKKNIKEKRKGGIKLTKL